MHEGLAEASRSGYWQYRNLIALGKVRFQPDLNATDPNARQLERPDGSDPVQLGYYYTRLCTGLPRPRPRRGTARRQPHARRQPAELDARAVPGNVRDRPHAGGQDARSRHHWNAIGKASPEEIEAIWA